MRRGVVGCKQSGGGDQSATRCSQDSSPCERIIRQAWMRDHRSVLSTLKVRSGRVSDLSAMATRQVASGLANWATTADSESAQSRRLAATEPPRRCHSATNVEFLQPMATASRLRPRDPRRLNPCSSACYCRSSIRVTRRGITFAFRGPCIARRRLARSLPHAPLFRIAPIR